MVVSRKDQETYLAKNLVFLRKRKDRTLDEMADLLSLSGKSSFKAYEDGRALPDIHKLMKLAAFFDVGIAELLYQDLENLKSNNNAEERIMFEVSRVPVAVAAGYAKGFGDNNYVKTLETIRIPFEPYGIARAFDISGDSMEPEINDGATVVGIKLNNSDIKDNKSYVVVSTEGFQCKHIRVDKESEFIYLISTNTKYPPKHLRKDEVLEIWEVWKKL